MKPFSIYSMGEINGEDIKEVPHISTKTIFDIFFKFNLTTY